MTSAIGLALLGWAWAMPFGDAHFPEGTAVVSRHVTTLDLTLQVRLLGAHHERELLRRHHQTSHIRATDRGLAIRWSDNEHRALEPGHAHDRTLPVVGIDYVLTDHQVVRTDGRRPTAEEVEIVQQVQLPAQLLALRTALGDDPEPGQCLPAPPMFAGILADAPGEPLLVDGSLCFDTVRDGVAHIAVALVLRSEGTDPKGTTIVTDATAAGSLQVDVASGRTQRLALEGTVEVRAQRDDLDTTGTGSFTTTTDLDFQ